MRSFLTGALVTVTLLSVVWQIDHERRLWRVEAGQATRCRSCECRPQPQPFPRRGGLGEVGGLNPERN